jgi:hypothetical protein
MAPKRLLSKLSKLTTDQQEYYIFLAKECFSGFNNAEYNFNVHRYASWLFHSLEFFWKSLTILSGYYFDLKHEVSQADMTRISKDLLSDEEGIKAYNILSQFPDTRRDLARYGYYEKGTHTTASPNAAFNRENTESDLHEVVG